MSGPGNNPLRELEFGLDTFGDLPADDSGEPSSYAAAIRQVVDEAVLADQLGVDVIALGEHHRPEYAISSPETVLAGIATRTDAHQARLGVTVLCSDDPVRVFQRFATLDALSNGRAEVILGRGSFTESFPLFGYDLSDYDLLFEEKIELFARLLDEKPVTWEGTTRAALTTPTCSPRPSPAASTPGSASAARRSRSIRTAHYGLPLMLAIIGGAPDRFAPYVDLYRRAAEQFGTVAHPVGMHSPGFVADTDEEAVELFWPGYQVIRDRIGAPPRLAADPPRGVRRRGRARLAVRRLARDRGAEDRGAVSTLDVGRFDLIYTAGGPPAARGCAPSSSTAPR